MDPERTTDSTVDDWFGQSVAEDAEMADQLVDERGEDAAEEAFDRESTGAATQEARRGETVDPNQGEHAYHRDNERREADER